MSAALTASGVWRAGVHRSHAVAHPRAVAIVLGPLGASPSVLERYESWYLERGCSVVSAASPPGKFMLNRSLRMEATAVWEETLYLLSRAESESSDEKQPIKEDSDMKAFVPIVIHSFSNGGCFLLEAMYEDLISNDSESRTNLRSHLQANSAQIFDSCPCYIRLLWDAKHFSDSFPHPKWSGWFRNLYTFGAALSLTIWCTLTCSWSRPRRFWDNMQSLLVNVSDKVVFIYSLCDFASDAAAVDRLVDQLRLQKPNEPDFIKVHKFSDSNHCQMDRDHSQEYQGILDAVLNRLSVRVDKTGSVTAQDRPIADRSKHD